MYGTWKTADNTQGTIPFAFEADFVDAIYKANENKLYLRTTMSIINTYLWIEYTKTTDSKSGGVIKYLNRLANALRGC